MVLLALVGASTLLALGELRSAVPSQAARRLHAVAASGPEPVRSALSSWVSSNEGLITACPAGAVDAAIELDVLHADLYVPFRQRDEWVRALDRLERDARQALACQPTNGLVWARLAFASWFLGQPAARQARYLDYSQLYAPAEMGALRARFAQWARVTPIVVSDASASFDRDLRTVLSFGPASVTVAMLRDMPATSRAAILEAARVLPPERSDALRARGIDLHSTDPGADGPTTASEAPPAR
ncbi:MAG: hypothetical protein ACK4U0_15205 [Mesorhizobium sp.]